MRHGSPFTVFLPEGLVTELADAAKACGVSPVEFAAQSVESVLASRRLKRVVPVFEPQIEDEDEF